MKKFVYSLLACLLPLCLQAQDNNSAKVDSLTQVVKELSAKVQDMEDDAHYEAVWSKRKKYFKIGFMKQTLTHRDISDLEWKSDFGISLAMGKTFYLHKKPLLGLLKFGLDFTYFDLSYAKYKEPEAWAAADDYYDYYEDYYDYYYDDEDEDLDLGCHQVEMGIGIGPSVTINPVSHLKVNAYFHFLPSASLLILNDELSAKFVPNFSLGGAVSYKVISLGVEYRWGKAKYNSFSAEEDEWDDWDDYDEDYDFDDVITNSKNRMKTHSVRFYVAFRF